MVLLSCPVWPAPAAHLHQCIFPVHLPFMVLAEYLHLPPELLHLGHPHDFAPLVVYLHAVDTGALLLTQLLLTQANTGQLLQVHATNNR